MKVDIHAIFFIRTSKFWLSLGLFLIFPIHLLKILAKSQPGCSYKVCSYKEKSVYMFEAKLRLPFLVGGSSAISCVKTVQVK